MSLNLDSGHALPGVFKCRRGVNLIVTESSFMGWGLVRAKRSLRHPSMATKDLSMDTLVLVPIAHSSKGDCRQLT